MCEVERKFEHSIFGMLLAFVLLFVTMPLMLIALLVRWTYDIIKFAFFEKKSQKNLEV